jgi:hypothetical protein
MLSTTIIGGVFMSTFGSTVPFGGTEALPHWLIGVSVIWAWSLWTKA